MEKSKSSFLYKRSICLLPLVLALFTFCEKEQEDIDSDMKISDDIISKLQSAGFNTNEGLFKYQDGYIVEYDIYLTDEQINELIDQQSVPSTGRTQHYRTSNLVSGAPRIILIWMDPAFNQGMQNAFDAALARYNQLDLRLTLQRTANANLSNIRIQGQDIPPNPDGTITLGFSSGFPSGGNPASPIVLNTQVYNTAIVRADAISAIAHEIGHAIGFRHTDFMNRDFSCNNNEGSEGGNAVHIAGTPTGPSANSWMLACSNGADRPFTANDIIALRNVYPSDIRGVYDLSSTHDRPISLDYDGDGDSDLIFYRPGSGIFYLFEFRNGAYVVRTSSYGFLNYNLNSVLDRIIALDYNGDGRDDVLLYRPGSGIVYIMRSEGNGNFTNVYASSNGFFGYDLASTNDKVIATDYNNDGRDDLVLYRPGSRIFYLFRSNGTTSFTQVVASGSGIGGFDLNESRDLIISLDYDGDGDGDLDLYRPGAKIFYLLRSNGNATYTRTIASSSGISTFDLNSISDRLIRSNIDGDAFDDIAAYRPGSRFFYMLRSNGSNFSATISSSSGIMGYDFNSSLDNAISLDYNVDGRLDLLCYRPSMGIIYYGRSTGSNFVRDY